MGKLSETNTVLNENMKKRSTCAEVPMETDHANTTVVTPSSAEELKNHHQFEYSPCVRVASAPVSSHNITMVGAPSAAGFPKKYNTVLLIGDDNLKCPFTLFILGFTPGAHVSQ